MESELTQLGLTPLQAQTYLYLLGREEGAKPTLLSKNLNITRTNCYKVLDQLTELDLVRRREKNKTYTYFAEDPIALTSLAGRARAHANDIEKRVQSSMVSLRKKYDRHHENNDVRVSNGKSAIIQALHAQNTTAKPIYFLKSRADIPFMGYDTMHSLRLAAKKTNKQRYGITQDTPESPNSPAIDERSNLKRTWIKSSDYASPVEWTVSEDELSIVVYEGNGKAIRIHDATVAESFRQIWKLLDESVRCRPGYDQLPIRARRQL